MTHKSYPIPAQPLEVTTEIKKSRFIAYASYVRDREEALAQLTQAKQRYPDARHHCWAYLIGNPASASNAAMNDDGEPSGTAGKPILNVIQHKGVGDIIIVVSRYFGGIKLGAGGLTRAYSGAAEAVMSQLNTTQQITICTLTITCKFAQEQPLRHWADQHQANIRHCHYSEQVIITLDLPQAEERPFRAWCDAHRILIMED